jgi:hypothetical protein
VAGVPKEQLMAQMGPFLGSAISTVTQTYERKMQEKDAELRRARAELADREAALVTMLRNTADV